MTTTEPTSPDHQGRTADVPAHVADAARANAVAAAPPAPQKPRWVDRFVWGSLWKVVAVVLAATVLLIVATRASDLLRMLIVSMFFALAMVPAVNHIHSRWGWKRGAAVGFVYACLVLFVVFMVVVLIPGIIEFTDQVQANSDDWVASINDLGQNVAGQDLIAPSSGQDAADATAEFVEEYGDNVLGFAASGIGLLFNMLTIAMFTFYMAADFPKMERALMSRMPPARQQVYGWVTDVSIEQTGGYFYSRLLLGVINGGLAFVVMLLLGLSPLLALPLAVFMGFVSEFIPAIGTYIGGAVPILVVFALQGLTAAAILLVWVVVYQQIENLFLSPRLSAQTMELNGAIAFGAALAGGAIAGPMGAFMALPVAAMITAVIKNTGKTYEVVYESKYDSDGSIVEPAPADEAAAATSNAT